jgi:hypothetical protein
MLSFCMVVHTEPRSDATYPRRPVSPSPRDLCGLGAGVYPEPSRRVLDCSFSFVFSDFQLSTFDLQPPLFPRSFPCHTSENSPVNPLAATLMDLPASVANKGLTVWLSPLDATLTKNRGVGVLWSFLLVSPYLYVATTYLLCLSLLRKLPGVYPKFPFWKGMYSQRSNRSTFKPSNDPLVPLQPNAFGATIPKGTRILHHPGKQLRSPRCLRIRERISETARCRSRSQTPIRSGLQVVPGDNVLTQRAF